jgi:hypothetical protein
MELFAARARGNLVRALRNDVRLMLPADPGPERMLEYIRLYDPRASPAKHGQIRADSLVEIYLSSGSVIDPDVAAEAGVPDGTGVAFFIQDAEHAQPFSWSDAKRVAKETYGIAIRLVNGLATRTGGIAWPGARILAEPLEAKVYTASDQLSADDVYQLAARYAPGLAARKDPTFGPYGVSSWRTPDGQFTAEHWPRGTLAIMLPDAPRSIGDLYVHMDQASAVRLQLSVPANQADPGTARLLGECALEVAAAADGICTDQLGFRVLRPDDIVFAGRA